MVKPILYRIFFLIFLSFSLPTHAVELDDLYKASILISSRDDVSERDSAYSKAMAEVLLKVTGTSESLQVSGVQRALNAPQSYVESFLYRSNHTELDENSFTEMEISFFQSEILDLIEANGLPLWPSNRQTTLIWIVVQEELGQREVLHSMDAANDEILKLLQVESGKRGLPLSLPLMDFQDQQALSVDDLWSLDENAILAASARYEAESVLVLRLYESLSGERLGKSLYLFRDRANLQESFDESLDQFIMNSVSLAADELSAYYTIRLSGGGEGFIVNLLIEGIDSTKAYSELLSYVEGLTDVSSYQIISIDQQQILFELSTGGQLRQLVETIALEDNLEVISEITRDENSVHMSYRWIK